jgi:hypothetical protein
MHNHKICSKGELHTLKYKILYVSVHTNTFHWWMLMWHGFRGRPSKLTVISRKETLTNGQFVGAFLK